MVGRSAALLCLAFGLAFCAFCVGCLSGVVVFGLVRLLPYIGERGSHTSGSGLLPGLVGLFDDFDFLVFVVFLLGGRFLVSGSLFCCLGFGSGFGRLLGLLAGSGPGLAGSVPFLGLVVVGFCGWFACCRG